MLELGLLVVIIVGNLVIGATGIIYYGTLILGGIFLIYWMVVWFSKIVKSIGKVCHWVKELLELWGGIRLIFRFRGLIFLSKVHISISWIDFSYLGSYFDFVDWFFQVHPCPEKQNVAMRKTHPGGRFIPISCRRTSPGISEKIFQENLKKSVDISFPL